MADYYRQSKSKSAKEAKVKYSRRERYSKEDFKCQEKLIVSATPPPPPQEKRRSMEKLLLQRENLKKKLESCKKLSDSDLNRKHKSEKNRKHSKSDYNYDELSKKRVSCNVESSAKKKRADFSPDRNGDYTNCESEDEDSVIEKRRQERKKLIEKLSTSKSTIKEEPNSNTLNHKNNSGIIESVKKEPVLKEVTDMFSDKDYFNPDCVHNQTCSDHCEMNDDHLADNWDDSEGYYIVNIGDILNNRYKIKNLLGKGVFSNVVHAIDCDKDNMDVAIKVVRNVDLMYRTSLKEIAFLKELGQEDPENKYHCIRYLSNFKHKGHLCIVLESLCMDLRTVIKKYGKHGINMKALISYSRQLLVALRLLKKIGLIHGDVKPDNILVNEKKNVLKLCDFGSATYAKDVEPTPYLVSRFYRAPEIILGVPYKHSIDIWSAACTIYEMATGKIMFAGSSNNKMLKCFMDLKGRFPLRFIKKGKFKDQHFNYNNNFLLHKKDEFSGREKYVEVSNASVTRDLHKELKKYCNTIVNNDEKRISHLKDLLDKMVIIDINQRLSVTECLKHPFIQH